MSQQILKMSRSAHRKSRPKKQRPKGQYHDTIRKPPRQAHRKQTKRNKQRRERGKQEPINSAEDFVRMKTCKSKSAFNTQTQATAAAINASRLIGQCRIYKCPYCKKYHLTTQV